VSPPGRLNATTSTVHASQAIVAPPASVWGVIEDPHHLPRWWPGVTRVESVQDERWTQVYLTKRGRPVRFDFRLVAAEPPRRLLWEQEIAGTPLERVLGESLIEILLEPDGAGTRVTIAQQQKLKGYSRAGRLILRSGTAAQLREALDGLARVCA